MVLNLGYWPLYDVGFEAIFMFGWLQRLYYFGFLIVPTVHCCLMRPQLGFWLGCWYLFQSPNDSNVVGMSWDGSAFLVICHHLCPTSGDLVKYSCCRILHSSGYKSYLVPYVYQGDISIILYSWVGFLSSYHVSHNNFHWLDIMSFFNILQSSLWLFCRYVHFRYLSSHLF